MSNQKPPPSPGLTVCPRCERKYFDDHGKCPQCDEVRTPVSATRYTSPHLLLWSIRDRTAYRSARSILAMFTVVGLIGGVALIGFGVAAPDLPDVTMITLGVVSLLVSTLQNLLGNAFLDIADASIRQVS